MINQNFKYDIKAGFSVFLLALPLCLGIAIASQFPPIAGVLTAIIGGLVSTFLGSSRLSIKGPAAGLIVIVLGAVNELGGGDMVLGYKRALAVGVVAAVIQILFSLFKWGKAAEIMPPSVIHGMLAAIGVIIIAKQGAVIFGVEAVAKSPLGLLAELPQNIMNLNPKIALIGGLSFLIVKLWPRFKKLNFVPAAIVVLLVSIPLTFFFTVGPQFLIEVDSQLLKAITFPDFSVVFSPVSLKYIVMYALVGSIESLLTVCAVDNLDPEKQASDLNKDLFSTGIGNLISSLVGGLPMISEIVRSKANIDYEAKSRFSNFYHGLFLLLSLLLIPGLLNMIPMAALAALLVHTGMRLASPSDLIKTFKIGKDQFFIFVSTMVITLLVDILVGVGVGLLLKIILHLVRGAKPRDFFKLDFSREEREGRVLLKIKGALVFSNFLSLKRLIQKEGACESKPVLDLSETLLVDHTIQMKLAGYKERGLLEIKGLDSLKAVSDHPLSFKKTGASGGS